MSRPPISQGTTIAGLKTLKELAIRGGIMPPFVRL